MDFIQEDFINTLNRVNFIFKNEDIYVECIKNSVKFSILGENFGPYEKGKKYKLKLFKAIPFIKNNIFKIISQEKCDNVDMQRYAIAERDDLKLFNHSNNFFMNKIKEFRKFMENDVKNGIIPQNSLENYNSYLTSVLDSRLLKVMRMAKSELTLDEEKRLTKSEQILFRIFYDIIKTWRMFFL